MRNKNNWLVLIIILLAFSLWVDLVDKVEISFGDKMLFERDVPINLGLDLRGGLQALLEADIPAEVAVDAAELENARTILENRANALGVSEVTMQIAGDRRIVAEFPGVIKPEEVVASLKNEPLCLNLRHGHHPGPPDTTIQTHFGFKYTQLLLRLLLLMELNPLFITL